MTDLLDISLKYIKDVNGLLSLREKINKINYINKRETIIKRNSEKNRAYIVNNYDRIKEYNKNYQKKS